MTLLDRLKLRIEIVGDDEDTLLNDTLDSARALFLSLRYPFSNYQVDEGGEPIIAKRWDDWLLRAAIEIYARIGGEGQVIHIENGIHRTYDTGTVSQALCSEITPVAGVVRK